MRKPQSSERCNSVQDDALIESGSGNGCLINLRKRAPRVGIRGGNGTSSTELQRLAALVQPDSPCWILSGYACRHNGHLIVSRDDGTRTHASRLAYELFIGPVPEGLEVCHRCDNGRCINPAHIFAGTHAENIHDSVRKGRKNCWGHQKLNAEQVHEIRAKAALGLLRKDIAKAYGIAYTTVSGIVNRKSWAHLHAPSIAQATANRTVQTVASRS